MWAGLAGNVGPREEEGVCARCRAEPGHPQGPLWPLPAAILGQPPATALVWQGSSGRGSQPRGGRSLPLHRADGGPGPPPGALFSEDPSEACPSAPVAATLRFPSALSPWAWRAGGGLLPAIPCPPPRGALGPSDFPLALTDSARVCSLINQCQARHRNKGCILPRPLRLIHPIVPGRFRWQENSPYST